MTTKKEMKPVLTILTVSFRSESLIEENIRLTKELNPLLPVRWLVVNNDGMPLPRLAGLADVVEGAPAIQSNHDKGSYHHAAGLMRGLKHVDTRFLLVLDPDYFILRKNALTEAIMHMRKNALSFFGASWDPLTMSKYQGFPCCHCMLIDLDRVPKGELDFTPELERTAVVRQRNKKLKKRFVHYPRLYPWIDTLRMFFTVRSSRDTGRRIYDRFRTDSHEVLDFAVTPERQARWELTLKRLPRRLRGIMPHVFGIQPKNIVRVDQPDLPFEFDKFYWKGEPFGVHLRRVAMEKKSGGLFEADDEGGSLRVLNLVLGGAT